MDLKEVNELTQYTLLGSNKFPYDTGTLHDNFFADNYMMQDNVLTQPILESPKLIVGRSGVNYGKLLEKAPSIRYAIRKVGRRQFGEKLYKYVQHENVHFRYIERIIEEDVIPMLESEYGVKRV